MPWREISTMSQRHRFVTEARHTDLPFSELCRRFRISRKTGYKWLHRYLESGPEALQDRSRKPESCPHATPPHVVRALLSLKRRHPTWGAAKLRKILLERRPTLAMPSVTTVHGLFDRHGMVRHRRRRPRRGHAGRPTTPMDMPNAGWTADFKGSFNTGDRRACYPFTLQDGYSRFLLDCKALPGPTLDATRQRFEHTFRTYGLPDRIRTDNGTPFASNALCRLSQLSLWWIRLGILPELIEPGKPQQNARHERMHKDLKAETARPPERNLAHQQRRFDRFRRDYNRLRPHEALGMETPASRYTPSSRVLPRRLPPLEYPEHFEVRRISANACFRWKGHYVCVGTVFNDHYLGLEETGNGFWTVYFGTFILGELNERDCKITDRLNLKRTRPRL